MRHHDTGARRADAAARARQGAESHFRLEAHLEAAVLHVAGTLTVHGALRALRLCEQLPAAVRTLRVDLRATTYADTSPVQAIAMLLVRWRRARPGRQSRIDLPPPHLRPVPTAPRRAVTPPLQSHADAVTRCSQTSPNQMRHSSTTPMRSSRLQRMSLVTAAVALLLAPAAARAQQPAPAPGRPDSAVTPTPPQPSPGQAPPEAAKTQQPPAAQRGLDFSGVIFGNFQYHTEAGANATNRFDLDRAYLTFRMPAGDRASIRATADVFKSATQGYQLRAKYAYLQYDYFKSAAASAVARLGILHTVEVDHEENFWPRWIAQVATERARFFSSADVGAATLVTLPGKWGEVYGTVTNGPGYANAGSDDRFKDYALRVSITPLAGGTPSLVRTLTISPWVYKGDTASKFVAGGAGQLGPVSRGLKRDRWGVLAGIRDPRLVIAASYAERSDESETGSNTLVSPVAVQSASGRVISAYTVFKPFLLADSARGLPLGVVLRYDDTRPDKSRDASQRFVIAGLTYDLNKRSALALDYQEQLPRNGLGGAPSKVYYAHFVANF